MKVIIGGGLIALLARDILGSDWKILPMGGSQFYSFSPSVGDSFIIKDNDIDDYMEQFTYIPLYHTIGYSIAGTITQNHNICLDAWLDKVYGSSQVPNQAKLYWKSHMEFFGYGDAHEMYNRLKKKYLTETTENHIKYGKIVSINNHIITTEKGHIEYDQIVSTIPMPVLMALLGQKVEMPSRDMYCYHLRTSKLDWEGRTQLFVVDPQIEFYKASKLSKEDYLFYSTTQIDQPGKYFMSFIEKFELQGEICVPNAIPCGPIPEFSMLPDNHIYAMGSRAQWDDCLDIGSCIKRLINYGGQAPKVKTVI